MPRYIDANQFNHFDYQKFDGPLTEDACQGIETVLREIDNAPTADVQEVQHGKWIYKYKGTDYDDIAYCSLCNFYSEDKINNIGQCFHYCPNCGARMDAEK